MENAVIGPSTNLNLHSRAIMTYIKSMAVVGSKINLHFIRGL